MTRAQTTKLCRDYARVNGLIFVCCNHYPDDAEQRADAGEDVQSDGYELMFLVRNPLGEVVSAATTIYAGGDEFVSGILDLWLPTLRDLPLRRPKRLKDEQRTG